LEFTEPLQLEGASSPKAPFNIASHTLGLARQSIIGLEATPLLFVEAGFGSSPLDLETGSGLDTTILDALRPLLGLETGSGFDTTIFDVSFSVGKYAADLSRIFG
jgi:hypothetical protein